jgi:two-component system, NarL family, response regulator NreC
MQPFRIILAEDHQAFRKLLRLELTCIPDLEIIGEVDDGLQLLELLEQVQPDLVILDISMPRLGGLEAARRIKEQHGQVKVLFLTMHKSPAYVEQARLIGAEGYLLKEEVDHELLSAIDLIRGGRRYLSSCFSSTVLEFCR